MSLFEKLKKNSTIKESSSLEKSKILDVPFEVKTLIPLLNVALGGTTEGGLRPGFLQITGPSKHFKTLFSLIIAAAYMRKFKDSVMLFYDCEFGASKNYFKAAGIDAERVLHSPFKNIEELKFDLINQLENIEKGSNVLIFIDSIGNSASKKEVEDAIDQKSVTDMTRAKALKSLWRMVTPYLTIKGIPLIAVNHTYKEIGLYPKDIVGGGTGGIYSADDIWIISRSQEKVGDEIQGYTFKINIEKSRTVKEKSVIPITVTFDGGVKRESGLLELGMEMGYVVKPTNGWYSKVDIETGEVDEKKYRAKELDFEWFSFMLDSDVFKKKVEEKYKLSTNALIDSADEYETEVVND